MNHSPNRESHRLRKGRQSIPEAYYFLTTSTFNRKPILANAEAARIIFQTFEARNSRSHQMDMYHDYARPPPRCHSTGSRPNPTESHGFSQNLCSEANQQTTWQTQYSMAQRISRSRDPEGRIFERYYTLLLRESRETMLSQTSKKLSILAMQIQDGVGDASLPRPPVGEASLPRQASLPRLPVGEASLPHLCRRGIPAPTVGNRISLPQRSVGEASLPRLGTPISILMKIGLGNCLTALLTA